MRVLQLGPYPPPHGGVQSNVVSLRAFLRKRGFSCAVINITRHRQADSDEIYYPENAFQLVKLLFRLRYDIIHLHIGGMLKQRLLQLGVVCTMMPARSVLTFHSGGYPSTREGRATGPHSFASFVFRRFNGVIGVNQEIMAFISKLGVPPNRARLIAPHACLAGVEPAATLPEPLQSFFRQHQPTLVSVGLLEPEYNLPIQIEALGLLRQHFPTAGLVLIGSGSLEQELRSKLSTQPWGQHILLCGDVDHAITLTTIERASAMLRTTLYDGDAISVREALHLGTPVIATDNGMRPVGVRLVPRSNLPALLSATEEALSSPSAPRSTPSAPDESNLQAVLDFYEELMRPKPISRKDRA